MLKRLVDGLIFGTGFGIAFAIIWIVAINFLLPNVAENTFKYKSSNSITETTTVPRIELPRSFLGSTNITSSGFTRGGVLASGDGKIIGSAKVNGEPVNGLKLRLALNGSVYSQWVTTDHEGQYVISVPYGDYIIEGFELDYTTANKYLPNKINHPQSPHSSTKFTVSSSSNGRGLNFRFIDPVIKTIKSNKFKKNEEIILEWEQYPGALTYSVQIYEKSDPYAWSNDTLFKWSDKPELLEPRINLNDYDIILTPGKFYTIEVSARNESNGSISESARTHSGYDFEITD